MSAIAWARIPSAERSSTHWHVAPWIDSAGYGWSWLWLLAPLLWVGSERSDYVLAYVLVLVLSDVHRHYGLPYVYLDAQIRRRYPLRFGLLAFVLLGAFVATPLWLQRGLWLAPISVGPGLAWLFVLVRVLHAEGSSRPDRMGDLARFAGPAIALPLAAWAVDATSGALPWLWLAGAAGCAFGLDWQRRARGAPTRFVTAVLVLGIAAASLPASSWLAAELPRGRVRFSSVFDAVAVAAGIWNFWHVYAQKYGILRLYNSKSARAAKTAVGGVPGWVDRWLIFAFLPVYVFGVVPSVEQQAYRQFRQARGFLPTLVDGIEWLQPVALPLAIAFLVGAIACFLVTEWRVNGLRNPARNSMALGTTALGASFLVFDPVKAYLAFAFSHAIEYMVFVWGFQRRRYRAPLPHDPPLGRILRHPVLAYGLFTALLCGVVLYLGYFGHTIFAQWPRPEIAGIRGTTWILAWTVYQSLMHFYFDGFLWKMRDDRLTADL